MFTLFFLDEELNEVRCESINVDKGIYRRRWLLLLQGLTLMERSLGGVPTREPWVSKSLLRSVSAFWIKGQAFLKK